MFNKTVKKRHHNVFKNSFLQIVFLQKKRHHIAKTVWRWVPMDPSRIFLTTTFTQKCQKAQIPCIPLLFHVTKYMTSSFYLSRPNCEFCSNCGSSGTRTKLEQIHNFL